MVYLGASEQPTRQANPNIVKALEIKNFVFIRIDDVLRCNNFCKSNEFLQLFLYLWLIFVNKDIVWQTLIYYMATDIRNISLNNLIHETIIKNRTHSALSNFGDSPITYAQLGEQIAAHHNLFRSYGLKPGDKIALCAKNSSNWAVTFLSALTYGAVSVPILHGFTFDSVQYLVSHSEAKMFFTEASLWNNLDRDKLKDLHAVIDLETNSVLFSRTDPTGVQTSTDDTYFRDKNDDLAIINYTSGSTGTSKGVMLTYGNLTSNAVFAVENIPYLHPGDGMVSMLPLAHMFGMLVELIFPLLKGCHIVFLGRTPTPAILLKAFAEVKPKLVVTVPLVIEKIVKNRIFPELKKQPVKTLLHIPLLKKFIYKKIRKSMLSAFGDNLHQLIIGGAALNADVEALLRLISFPYTVGYGMTECAPLIAYCPWDSQKPGSCGKIVDRMHAKIDSVDPATIPGVLWVKGDNVMHGYFHNAQATADVMDGDWMNTGDICLLDNDGYLFIKGRDKAMILGASGQNIYPEEIENKLNNLPLVSESLVIDRQGKLIALVYPDFDAAAKAHISKEKIDELMDYNLATINKQVPTYSKLNHIELRDEPFEKTPKMSIKRYLYK